MAAKKKDLGSGSVNHLMLELAVPAVIAQVINILYNIVDRIFIGHMADASANALTGVGLFNPILMLITAFAVMVGTGGAPLAAIAMGQDNKNKAEKILGNSVGLLIIFAVVLTILFELFCPTLMLWFGGSEATLPYAVSYGRIYIAGIIFVLIVQGLNPFITTQGFARISMMTTMIGAILNIILDPVMIFALHMGVQGAALATVISQAVGAVWVLLFLTGKQTIIKVRKENLIPVPQVFIPCLSLGISTFVMNSTESLLSIAFNSSLSHYGGDQAVAAMTVLTSVMTLVFMPLQGICMGGQPIMSFNFGANKRDRVKKAFKTQFTVCVSYAVICWAVLMLMPQVIAGIFTSDQGLIDYVTWAMRIYLATCFMLSLQTSCQQAFMALGQAKISLCLACLRKLVLLIPMILILPHFFDDKVFAVFLAEPVSDFIAASVTAAMFFTHFNGILDKGARKV